ncbi:MAG: hypothetical protein V3V25_13200 [Paracoccaceae bacterium]
MPTFILIFWPVVAITIFAATNFRRAFICSIIWGYLFLPENFKLNIVGLPSLDKTAAVSLGALAGYILYRRKARAQDKLQPLQGSLGWTKTDLIIGVVLAVQFIAPIFSYLNNAYPIFLGEVVVNAATSRDVTGAWFISLVQLTPYFIAAKILNKKEDHVEILKILVFTGLIYSLLILFEARMSPQLHVWVYGFFQHEFSQHVRGGHFRPIVFLRHGLWIGFFLFTILVASTGLLREKGSKRRIIWILATLWFCLLLVISRNFGATLLSLLLVPAIFFTKPRSQIKITAIISLLFLLYPAVRQMELVPLDRMSAAASQFSTERAASFDFRVKHEDALLEHASLKPYFGWGDWGRSRIRDATGKDLTVADGIWIIILGSRGWVGYIGFFGLLTLPLIVLGLVRNGATASPATASIAVIMGGNFIYMIPNSVLSPIGWMLAGALLGYLRTTQINPKKQPVRQNIQYSRPKELKKEYGGYARKRS